MVQEVTNNKSIASDFLIKDDGFSNLINCKYTKKPKYSCDIHAHPMRDKSNSKSYICRMHEHSFVIPAYKDSPYLESCVKSLLHQTVKSELVIATATPSQ